METQERLWYKSCFRPSAITYPLIIYMCITQLFIQHLKGEKSVTKATAILCVTKAIFKIKNIGKAHVSVSLRNKYTLCKGEKHQNYYNH